MIINTIGCKLKVIEFFKYDFDELPNNFNDNRHEQGLGLTRQERIDYWVKKTSVLENK